MAFTVDKMLQMREFSDCCLVAGAEGKNRIIQCVDSMEIPDITPWLEEGELLITTGYSVMNRLDLQLALLDAMHKAGSAGLAIKTRFIGALSPELLARAEQYELPLIVVPDDKAFIPMINAIGGCLAEENNQTLLFSLAISKEISAAQQSENYIKSIEEIIYRYLKLPVVLVDFLLLPYEIYPPDAHSPITQDGFKEQLFQYTTTSKDSLFVLPGCGDSDSESLVVQKIVFKNVITGYLVMPVPRGSDFELNAEVVTLLSYAGDALAFYLSNLQSWGEQTRKRDRALYAKLVQEGPISDDIIRHWISQYNWPVPPLNLITFDLSGCAQRFGTTPESVQLQILWILHAFFVDNRIPCIEVPHDNGIRCIISERSRPAIRQVLSSVLEKLDSDMNMQPWVAVSAPIPSYAGLVRAHREAYQIIQIGSKLGMHVAFAEELTLELALTQGIDKDSLRAFVKLTLGALEEYDAENHTALLQTAQALVDHMGIHTQTAKALYLHRNTLLGRIQRIKTLTGLDMSCSDDLYKVSVALKLRKLLADPLSEQQYG